ncbi:Hypothetical protein FKW44_023093 [Caligus rogercresseyi]|uniref:Uncharacterized protein n=1 Tax=Caligus rogercresseyi TaxID=217165 RepID=A0A7T8GNU5_CALRO|nr:Hypothetical protein FKW44_023093 [Caligus rogercresseyi]
MLWSVVVLHSQNEEGIAEWRSLASYILEQSEVLKTIHRRQMAIIINRSPN